MKKTYWGKFNRPSKVRAVLINLRKTILKKFKNIEIRKNSLQKQDYKKKIVFAKTGHKGI